MAFLVRGHKIIIFTKVGSLCVHSSGADFAYDCSFSWQGEHCTGTSLSLGSAGGLGLIPITSLCIALSVAAYRALRCSTAWAQAFLWNRGGSHMTPLTLGKPVSGGQLQGLLAGVVPGSIWATIVDVSECLANPPNTGKQSVSFCGPR